MEQRFTRVRQQLDDLGYLQVLIPEALPLVEKLTADLVQTTESLQKYKKIAKDALQERDSLQLGAEPYKCDNSKLVKECNDLHLAFLQVREQNEKSGKDLKRRLSTLEKDKLNCELECERLRKRIRNLEVESANKTDRILTLQNKNLQAGSKLGSKGVPTGISKSRTSTAAGSKSNTEISTTMALADQKIANLTKEIKKLKDEQLQLTEMNCTYKTQLINRDREIERLNQMLEGGRPIQALNQDCCYKNVEGKLYLMQKELCSLDKEKEELEARLKDAVNKQHEAMKRALNLADRNKQLEQELRDIDQMALAVEADCNTTVKNNAEKVTRLQEKVHEAVLQIQTLERDVAELKRDKQELLSDTDALKLEKKHLQTVLETALDEKKRLNDRINQFTVIEHDLNLEIDRLVQTSANQKRKIAELECKVLSGKLDAVSDRSLAPEQQSRNSPSNKMSRNAPPAKSPTCNSFGKFKKRIGPPTINPQSQEVQPLTITRSQLQPNKQHNCLPCSLPPKSSKPKKNLVTSKSKGAKPSKSPQKVKRLAAPKSSPNNSPMSSRASSAEHNYDNDKAARGTGGNCSCCKCCKDSRCRQNIQPHDVLDGGEDYSSLSDQPPSKGDRYKSERDYYMKEYHHLLEKMENISSKPDNLTELQRKLNEREQLIATLQHENKTLAQEKHNLMTRLETARDKADASSDRFSITSQVRRMERDQEMLKGDILRLEEERNALRQRLKMATDNHMAEHARMEKSVMDLEDQVRQLEHERRDLMQSQGSRRATISTLEDQCEALKEQLRMCQMELNHQRALYTQLKTLHEQTDKALGDSQGQLIQVESELQIAHEKVRGLETDRGHLNQEVASLKSDILMIKGSLTQIDQEKDGLLISVDDKTERMAMLEQELRVKEEKLIALELTVADLKKKLSLTADGASAKEHLLRSASAESASLRQELESAARTKENAIQENRRLQNELTAITLDCRCTSNELEVSKRQIEDLKRQLQHYVAEVKRFEDLMSQKELERTDLLDQFRSLSQEASLLENSNHNLESEATQSKVQLSVTLDHVADLETKLTRQDGKINGYEKQIAELTSQLTNLESQLSHYRQQQERCDADLVAVRDLCMKLDKQKDNLMQELNQKDEQRSQVDREMLKIRRESETLQSSLMKDRTSLDNLERLLADARQETVKQTLYNQELESEIKTLREKIEELQAKVISTSDQLDFYQERALDYSQQNKQLRRDIASERFFRAKEEEGKRYPSLSPTTATFTYSANLGRVYDTKSCACRTSCHETKGEVIDTSAVSHQEKKDCYGDCAGHSQKQKRFVERIETKAPMWKSFQERQLLLTEPVNELDSKNRMSFEEKFQNPIRTSCCNPLCQAPAYTATGLNTQFVEEKFPNQTSISSSQKVEILSRAGAPFQSASVSPPSIKGSSKLFEENHAIWCEQCTCGVQKRQQVANKTDEADGRFHSNYDSSKAHEIDNTRSRCFHTSNLPTGPTYTTHYSVSKNNTN